jgi:hypothetical protein
MGGMGIMNVLDWLYRAIMNIGVGTHKGDDIDLGVYKRTANPNATNSELDAKVIIHHSEDNNGNV